MVKNVALAVDSEKWISQRIVHIAISKGHLNECTLLSFTKQALSEWNSMNTKSTVKRTLTPYQIYCQVFLKKLTNVDAKQRMSVIGTNWKAMSTIEREKWLLENESDSKHSEKVPSEASNNDHSDDERTNLPIIEDSDSD